MKRSYLTGRPIFMLVTVFNFQWRRHACEVRADKCWLCNHYEVSESAIAREQKGAEPMAISGVVRQVFTSKTCAFEVENGLKTHGFCRRGTGLLRVLHTSFPSLLGSPENIYVSGNI